MIAGPVGFGRRTFRLAGPRLQYPRADLAPSITISLMRGRALIAAGSSSYELLDGDLAIEGCLA
jgi:hypothetical protein